MIQGYRVISFSVRTGVSSTLKYFDEHLSSGDYYDESGGIAGEWFGQGAELLGLQGRVSREHFEALANNINPQTNERLTARHNTLRTDSKTGEIVDNRRTFYDIAISPPKDVSVLYALGNEQLRISITQLHDRSAKIAAGILEEHAAVRERAAGKKDGYHLTGNAVVAIFRHDTARPVDGVPAPHLHTHLVFSNATFDKASQRWMALQNAEMMHSQQLARQAYYNEIAKGLEQLGYVVEARERYGDFTIRGVDQEIIQQFSKRHALIEARAGEMMDRGWRDRESAEDMAAGESREKKVTLSPIELRKLWVDQIERNRLEKLHILMADAAQKKLQALPLERQSMDISDAVKFAKNHAFGKKAVVHKSVIVAEVVRRARGRTTVEAAKKAVENDDGFLPKEGNQITTRAVIAEESEILRRVTEGLNKCRPLASPDFTISPENDARFSEEQKQAVAGVLSVRDRITAINGAAGAGKTTLLAEVIDGIEDNGGRVFLLAPSAQAAAVLGNQVGVEAETLQQWNVNAQLRRETSGAVLIVDEAGMISSPDMATLLREAERNGNRVVLVGDVQQLQAVGRGAPFKAIQEKTEAKTFRIEETQRHQVSEYKSAMNDFRQGAVANAFHRLDNLGWVREVSPASGDLHGELVKQASQDNAPIAADRWEQIDAIAGRIRAQLLSDGKLGKDVLQKSTVRPLDTTAAERGRLGYYEPGHVLTFHRAVPGVAKKGDSLRITECNERAVVVVGPNGREMAFAPHKHAGKFTVGQEAAQDLRSGDRVLLKANDKEAGLRNGMMGTVEGWNDKGDLQLRLDPNNTVTIPASYQHMVSGWAATAHALQGATFEKIHVLTGAMRESEYVKLSRATHEVTVWTDNLEATIASAERSSAKPNAIDLEDAHTGDSITENVGKEPPESKAKGLEDFEAEL